MWGNPSLSPRAKSNEENIEKINILKYSHNQLIKAF